MKYLFFGLILIILVFLLRKYQENFEQGIFKRTAFKNNSINLNSIPRLGVLINLRPQLGANTYSYELDYNDMNRLLSKLVKKEYFFKNEDNLEEDLSKNIIHRINQKYNELNLNSEFHPNDDRKYELVDFDLLKKEKISKLSHRSIINIQFYKHLKDISYNIQVTVIYSDETLTYVIEEINIVGIDLNEHILMKNKGQIQKYCSLLDMDSLGKCHGDELLEEDEMKTFFKNLMEGNEQELSKKEIKFLEDKEKEKINNLEYNKFKCFDNEGFNESTCNSYSFRTRKKGTWDKPCTKDEECPFYKGNKNYPNSRGGCLQGYCEFPINMVRKGFKKYDLNKKPFCYNCNIPDCLGEDCYTCCDKQKNPDYMFKNDKLTRNKFFK
tara:strand:+ start:298 stop:1443 length:1146 start_codon:yes stop_codon:yes gene_type:complete